MSDLERVRGGLSSEEFDELVAMLAKRRDVGTAGGRPAARPRTATEAPKKTGRRTFGHSWWGQAWVEALEQRARLDANRLPRGRTYARHNHVLRLEVEPGDVSAFVQGSRPNPYRVQVGVRQFGEGEWDRLLDTIAGKAAHSAALLDGELDPGIVDDAERAGIDLLPTAGELAPFCDCPDWAEPCKHAAAVCYLIADLLDTDPFNLLLLRGKPRNEVLAAIRSRRQSTATRPAAAVRAADVEAGMRASELYRDAPAPDRDELARLGHVPVGAEPGEPPPLAVDPPAASGILADDLTDLAADAARRAFAMLIDGGPSGLDLDADHDIARRAAIARQGPDAEARLHRLGTRAGRPAGELERDGLAWQCAGAEGIAILHDQWKPDAGQLDEGRAALRSAGSPVRATGNRLTSRHVQLRLAPSGTWYRLDNHDGAWELNHPGAADPAELL
ncbi:MAG: SWIM zinc finger family protein [Actinobacteria bacterium]|nr:SWIM zinc finger family protein [Actinomycetota bacterium]